MSGYKLAVSLLILTLPFCIFNSVAAVKCVDSGNDYPYNQHQDPVQQKAKSGERIYFYALPNEACKTNTFIINNDNVLKYRESNGFSFVNYVDKKGAVIDGWVKSENVTKSDEKVNYLTYGDFAWQLNGEKVNLLGKATSEMDTFIKSKKIKSSEPDNHGFNKGFESWTLLVQGEMITISQTNTIIEKRLGYNDTFVSGITFVDNKYKTARGVAVGDGWDTVVSKYGNNSKLDTDDECRYYQYFDRRLSFCLDSSNKVQSILLENYPVGP